MSSQNPEEYEDHQHRRRTSSRKSTPASMSMRSRRPRMDELREDIEHGNDSAIDSDTDSGADSDHGHADCHDHPDDDPGRAWNHHHQYSSHHRKRTTSGTSRVKMASPSFSADPGYSHASSHIRTGSKSMHRNVPSNLASSATSTSGPSASSTKHRTKSSSSRSKAEPETSGRRRKSSSSKSVSNSAALNSDQGPPVFTSPHSRSERRSHQRRRHESRYHDDDSNTPDHSDDEEDKQGVDYVKDNVNLSRLNIDPAINVDSDAEKCNSSEDETNRPLLTAGDDEKKTEDEVFDNHPNGSKDDGTADDADVADGDAEDVSETDESPEDTQPTDTESQPEDHDKQLISVDPNVLESAIEAAAAAKQKDAQNKDSSKGSRHRSARKNSSSKKRCDEDLEPNHAKPPRAPSPPVSHAAESDIDEYASESEPAFHNKGHSRRTSSRSIGKSSSRRPTSENFSRPTIIDPPLSHPMAVPMGMPTSQRLRRSRRSNGEWVEHDITGSLGSDHRGSFSRAPRPPADSFSRRPTSGSFERGWNPHTESGNSYMSQSPSNGAAMESDSEDENANPDHDAQPYPSPRRSSRHRNSHSQHSSTPPKPKFRRQSVHDRSSREPSSRSGLPPAPDFPPTSSEGFSSRRPHHPPRTISGSSGRNMEVPMPPVPHPQDGNGEKRRRPSYSGVRPGTSSQQRSNSAIPEESDTEINYSNARRPSMHDESSTPRSSARRGSDRHSKPPPLSNQYLPPVPLVPGETPDASDGYDDSLPKPTATELDYADADNQDCDSSTDFPEDMDTLAPDHPFLKTREKLNTSILRHFRQHYNNGPMRSPLNSRFETPTRRPRGGSRVDEIQHEAEDGFFGNQSPTGRRRSTPSGLRGFACPFTKHNPQQFAGCGGFVFDNMKEVGKHLRWCHRNTISCPRCMKTFPNQRERDDHSKEDPPCLARSERRHNGLEREARQRISNIIDNNAQNEHKQYMSVYKVIFPNHGPPESPYIDEIILRDLTAFKEWFNRHGEELIYSYLAKKHLLHSHGNRSLDDDLRTFKRSMCENGCYLLYNDWLDHSEGNDVFAQGPDLSWVGSNDASSSGFSPRTPLTAGTSWGSSGPAPQASGGVGAGVNGGREPCASRDSTGQYTPTVPSNRRSSSNFEERYDHSRGTPRRQSISRGITIPPGPGASPKGVFGRSSQPPLTPQGPVYGHDDEYMAASGGGMAGMGLGMNINSGPGGYYGETMGVFDGLGSMPMGGNLNMNMAAEEYMNNGYFSGHGYKARYPR
ncbi:uncharacterized protein BROUX77_004469 [Berkeleyomyces rouxiae]|uniref:uncharacterized protein n=1 Tax=Berkeleyomyces rouxiae TaxID=2035830 RepID=UPI003B7BB839